MDNGISVNVRGRLHQTESLKSKAYRQKNGFGELQTHLGAVNYSSSRTFSVLAAESIDNHRSCSSSAVIRHLAICVHTWKKHGNSFLKKATSHFTLKNISVKTQGSNFIKANRLHMISSLICQFAVCIKV